MEKETTKNEPQHIEAGEVLEIQYKGDNKPCKRALALLIKPVTLNSNVRDVVLLYSIDADTMEFLPSSSHNDLQASIRIASKEQRAMYYERVLELVHGQRGKEVQP